MQTGTASLHPKNATLGTRPPKTGQWKRKSWRVPLFRACLLIRTGPHSAYVDIRKHKTPSHADCSPLRTSESARHSTTTSAIATRPPARMLPPDTFGTSMHLCNNSPQPATKLTRVPTHFHHLEPRNEAAVAPGFVACKIHVSLYLCYSKTRIAPTPLPRGSLA